MEKLKKLLAKGFFPSQLPPPFSASAFARSYPAITATWPTLIHKIPSTRGEFFSVARAGHMRRPVTIPNPINQYFLVKGLCDYWPQIQKHFKQSKLSLSRPTLGKGGERATEIAPLSELYERRLTLSAGYRYVLKTDISRFFPTLYTHSLPWALHGKANAKSHMRDMSAAFFGNVLDTLMQRCQQRQTLGIPIGPDSSHIVAEIIASAADIHIREQLGKWPKGYRHVDDYFLCFNSAQEAENALSVIVRALREYELDINVNKTQIIRVDDLLEDTWVDPLRAFEFEKENEQRQRNDIHRFFALALDQSRRHSDENVMKYALRKSTSFVVHEANWRIYQAYLLRAARAHLNTLQTVTSIISTYSSLGYKIDKVRIAEFCEDIIGEAAPLAHHSEVAWALWLAIELRIRLSKRLCTSLESMTSSTCVLIALDCRDRGLLPALRPSPMWTDAMDAGGLRGSSWMLAYEAGRKGWLPEKSAGYLGSDEFFATIDAHDVAFYDAGRRLKPLIRKVASGGEDFGLDEDQFEFEDFADEYVS